MRNNGEQGGATDQCRDNLRAAWPLLQQVGQSDRGLFLLSKSINSCTALQSEDDLGEWAQSVFFFMAEGNYPFPSTYITFSLLPGKAFPLPAWPMRVACEGLNKDFGIKLKGSIANVNYTLALGDIDVAVDWANTTGNGANLTSAQIAKSGILELAAAVANAAGVWYNVTKDQECYDIAGEGDASQLMDRMHRSRADIKSSRPASAPKPRLIATKTQATTMANTRAASRARPLAIPNAMPNAIPNANTEGLVLSSLRRKDTTNDFRARRNGPKCPTCPPCDDCPPCPVSYCDWEDSQPCSFEGNLSKTFSWEGIGCNDALYVAFPPPSPQVPHAREPSHLRTYAPPACASHLQIAN